MSNLKFNAPDSDGESGGHLFDSAIYQQRWHEFCSNCLQQGNVYDFIAWYCSQQQIPNQILDGAAILNKTQEIIWFNPLFQQLFPRCTTPEGRQSILYTLESPRFAKGWDTECAEGDLDFLSNSSDDFLFEEDFSEESFCEDETDFSENETCFCNKNNDSSSAADQNDASSALCTASKNDEPGLATDPFSEFLLKNANVKSTMEYQDGRFFEVEVQHWFCPGSDEIFMLVLVHNATERQELNRQLVNLHNMCDTLSHTSNLKDRTLEERRHFLNDGVKHMAKSLLHYEFLEMREYNNVTKNLEICAYYGIEKEAVSRQIRADLTNNGIIGYVACTKKSYICPDTQKDPHYLIGGETARSSLTVPITFQDELFGILNAESSRPNAFDEKDKLYMEIFAHEIAFTMNMLHLLDEEKKAAMQVTAEQIHGKIALPIKNIIEQGMCLNDFLGEDQLDAQKALLGILNNGLQISQLVQEVGMQLPAKVVTPSDQEIIQGWGTTFQGKRFLLVEPDPENASHARDLFNALGSCLDIAVNAKEAENYLQVAFLNKTEYFAILSIITIDGYTKATQFFINLAKYYGKRQPPLILLQDIGVYDNKHTIVNVRTRYPQAGQTGRPFNVNALLKTINATVSATQGNPPNFAPLESEYDDPWATPRKQDGSV